MCKHPRTKVLALGATIVLATTFLTVATSEHARAATAPAAHLSYYMRTTSKNYAYNHGCTQGTHDSQKPGTQHTLVILDFGALSNPSAGVWKFSLFAGSSRRASTVADAVKQWALGYYICTGSDIHSTLTLALGTNTSAGDVTAAAGSAWQLPSTRPPAGSRTTLAR